MTLQQLQYTVEVANEKSMNQAAMKLYISQPTLSNAIKELEKEVGMTLFKRSNKGIVVSPEGEEFLRYARQMLEYYDLMEERYVKNFSGRKKFSVSMQHYTFAVEAFISLVNSAGMEKYEFSVHEARTSEVIEHVRTQKSELGVLYINEFNDKMMEKILRNAELEFVKLFTCSIFVYLSKSHPLAGKKELELEDLPEYPCLSFEQGDNNSFYFAEEVLSTYDYKRIIRADDRATMLNLMVGLNGYTLCSGIICEKLNGEDYMAVPLKTEENMTIGYIKKSGMPLSRLAELYVENLKSYKDRVL